MVANITMHVAKDIWSKMLPSPATFALQKYLAVVKVTILPMTAGGVVGKSPLLGRVFDYIVHWLGFIMFDTCTPLPAISIIGPFREKNVNCYGCTSICA